MITLPYSKWVGTPLFIRQKIAREFGIAKVRSTSVVNDYVMDDGYEIHAVEGALQPQHLQKFLNSDEKDILVLFQHLIDVMEGKIAITPKEEVKEETIEITETITETIKVKKPRAKKK